jgi:protein gp37
VNHLFNRIHDSIIETKGDGALISIEAESWSILFWDHTHRPRFVRSRWRDSRDRNKADYEIIAKDVERLVRAYVLAEIGRKIEKVYLSAVEEEGAEFSRCLDARMRVPCVYFNVTKEFTVATTVSIRDAVPGVLAAAVSRL